jgi:hypothetical protein
MFRRIETGGMPLLVQLDWRAFAPGDGGLLALPWGDDSQQEDKSGGNRQSAGLATGVRLVKTKARRTRAHPPFSGERVQDVRG